MTTRLAFSLAALLAAGSAHAGTAPSLDAAIDAYQASLAHQCREASGPQAKMTFEPGFVRRLDINVDGRPDAVMSMEQASCDGAPSMSGGSLGYDTTTSFSQLDGTYVSHSGIYQAVTVLPGPHGSVTALKLVRHGSTCGRRSGLEPCNEIVRAEGASLVPVPGYGDFPPQAVSAPPARYAAVPARAMPRAGRLPPPGLTAGDWLRWIYEPHRSPTAPGIEQTQANARALFTPRLASLYARASAKCERTMDSDCPAIFPFINSQEAVRLRNIKVVVEPAGEGRVKATVTFRDLNQKDRRDTETFRFDLVQMSDTWRVDDARQEREPVMSAWLTRYLAR